MARSARPHSPHPRRHGAGRSPGWQLDAIHWLALRLATPWPGQLHLIYNTIALQYFPQDKQAQGRRVIEAAGATAKHYAPLTWLGIEVDESTPGAGLFLRLWPGDLRIDLGRAGFHGEWVDWRA